MQAFRIGMVIRELRKRQKKTLEWVSEGVCDAATLSRIELGKYQPSKEVALLLLQRLGVVTSDYFGLRNFDELEIEELKLGMKNANAQQDYKLALTLLDKLEAALKGKKQSRICRQFILTQRAINGYLDDGKVIKYPLQTRLDMLCEAIVLSVPKLDYDRIEDFLLGLDEVTILINIANTYSKMEQYRTAIGLYSQLMRCVEVRLMDISEASIVIPLLTYNYSRVLGRENRHEECIEIAEVGIDCCVKYGKSRLLGELLINKACALHRLGLGDGGRADAIRSYYLLDAMGMKDDAETVRQHLLDVYGVEVI